MLPDPVTGDSDLLVGDTSAMWFYNFAVHFNDRGGPSDVALATDEVAQADFVNGTGFTGTGNAFYLGGFLGLEFGY